MLRLHIALNIMWRFPNQSQPLNPALSPLHSAQPFVLPLPMNNQPVRLNTYPSHHSNNPALPPLQSAHKFIQPLPLPMNNQPVRSLNTYPSNNPNNPSLRPQISQQNIQQTQPQRFDRPPTIVLETPQQQQVQLHSKKPLLHNVPGFFSGNLPSKVSTQEFYKRYYNLQNSLPNPRSSTSNVTNNSSSKPTLKASSENNSTRKVSSDNDSSSTLKAISVIDLTDESPDLPKRVSHPDCKPTEIKVDPDSEAIEINDSPIRVTNLDSKPTEIKADQDYKQIEINDACTDFNEDSGICIINPDSKQAEIKDKPNSKPTELKDNCTDLTEDWPIRVTNPDCKPIESKDNCTDLKEDLPIRLTHSDSKPTEKPDDCTEKDLTEDLPIRLTHSDNKPTEKSDDCTEKDLTEDLPICLTNPESIPTEIKGNKDCIPTEIKDNKDCIPTEIKDEPDCRPIAIKDNCTEQDLSLVDLTEDSIEQQSEASSDDIIFEDTPPKRPDSTSKISNSSRSPSIISSSSNSPSIPSTFSRSSTPRSSTPTTIDLTDTTDTMPRSRSNPGKRSRHDSDRSEKPAVKQSKSTTSTASSRQTRWDSEDMLENRAREYAKKRSPGKSATSPSQYSHTTKQDRDSRMDISTEDPAVLGVGRVCETSSPSQFQQGQVLSQGAMQFLGGHMKKLQMQPTQQYHSIPRSGREDRGRGTREGGDEPPLIHRNWSTLWKVPQGPRSGRETYCPFTIMSYNVLSQNLIQENFNLYAQIPHLFLSWEYRREGLLKEMMYYKPDIMCLQEVHRQHYNDFYAPKLDARGYGSVYISRTGDKMDGCATFYNKAVFELDACEKIEYRIPNVHWMNRDNVGLVTRFRVLPPRGMKSNDRNQSQRNANQIVVGNTHLLFNPRRGDIKLAQLQMLLATMDRLAYDPNKPEHAPYYPCILCGDMNAKPKSSLVEFLLQGSLQYEGLWQHEIAGKTECRGMGKLLVNRLMPMHAGITDRCQFGDEVVARLEAKRALKLKASVVKKEIGAEQSGGDNTKKDTKKSDSAATASSSSDVIEIGDKSEGEISDDDDCVMIVSSDQDSSTPSTSTSKPTNNKSTPSTASTSTKPANDNTSATSGQDLTQTQEYRDNMKFETGTLRHSLRFNSVYRNSRSTRDGRPLPEEEWEATTHHSNVTCAVDYIMYSAHLSKRQRKEGRVSDDKLKLCSRLDTFSGREMEERVGLLPNAQVSSDHISLMAKFALLME